MPREGRDHVPDPQPEPEPEPEPLSQRRDEDEHGDEETSGLIAPARSTSSSVSFDSSVQTSIVYDLEAILPARAVANNAQPTSCPRTCASAAGRGHKDLVQLALYSLGYLFIQSALWSGAWDSALRFSIPGWLAFLAWAVVYRRDLRYETISVPSIARATRVDAEELRAKAEAMGVDVDTEAFLLPVVADAIRSSLPEAWVDREGLTGKYYYNTITRERVNTNPLDRQYMTLIAAERRAYHEVRWSLANAAFIGFFFISIQTCSYTRIDQ